MPNCSSLPRCASNTATVTGCNSIFIRISKIYLCGKTIRRCSKNSRRPIFRPIGPGFPGSGSGNPPPDFRIMRSHRRPAPDFLPSGTTVFGRFRSTDTEKRMFFREISGRFFDATGRTGRCKWRNPTVRAVRICGSDSNSRKKRRPISAAVSDEMSYSVGCVRRILV